MYIYFVFVEGEGDYFFDGEQVLCGLYGLFVVNWCEELFVDFEVYVVFKICYGVGDVYIMCFVGQGI